MFEIMLKFRGRMKQSTPQLKRVTERVRITYHEFGEGYRNALNTCNNKGRFCNTRYSEWPYSLSEFLDLAENGSICFYCDLILQSKVLRLTSSHSRR
jgi:hypothetical protein